MSSGRQSNKSLFHPSDTPDFREIRPTRPLGELTSFFAATALSISIVLLVSYLKILGIDAIDTAVYALSLVYFAIFFGQREAFVSLIIFAASEIIQTPSWTTSETAKAIFLLLVGFLFIIVRPALYRDVERARKDVRRLQVELTRLQVSEREARELFRQAPIGLARLELDGRWLDVNDRLCELVGYSENELRQRTFASLTHPDDLSTNREEMHSLVSGNIGLKRKRYIRKDGHSFWAARGARLIRTASGAPSHYVVAIEDIAVETDTTNEMRRQITETTQKIDGLRSALLAAGTVAFEYRRDSQTLRELSGVEALLPSNQHGEPTLDTLLALTRPQDRERLDEAFRSTPQNDYQADISFAVRHVDGSERQMRLRGRNGRRAGEIACGVIFDETWHREQENSRALRLGQELLVKELTHRLGNIFPVISTMIRMTAESRPDAAELISALQHRVRSLALTHRLLAARGLGSVDLEELLQLEIAPYRADQRIVLTGPPISLTGGMAESFSIIAHELVTNAAKHGALGTQTGEIEATWRVVANGTRPHLHFDWIERKTAAADLTAKAGFGSCVLGLRGEPIVGTKAMARATEDGLHYTLTLQLDRQLSLAEEFIVDASARSVEGAGSAR